MPAARTLFSSTRFYLIGALANENFPRPSILLLRSEGYAVKSIQEDYAGNSDEQVIALATAGEQTF